MPWYIAVLAFFKILVGTVNLSNNTKDPFISEARDYASSFWKCCGCLILVVIVVVIIIAIWAAAESH